MTIKQYILWALALVYLFPCALSANNAGGNLPDLLQILLRGSERRSREAAAAIPGRPLGSYVLHDDRIRSLVLLSLEDTRKHVRLSVLTLLSRMREISHEEIRNQIERLFRDGQGDEEVRAVALRALLPSLVSKEIADGYLAEALRSHAPGLHKEGLIQLGYDQRSRDMSDERFSDLLKFLKDDDPALRTLALEAAAKRARRAFSCWIELFANLPDPVPAAWKKIILQEISFTACPKFLLVGWQKIWDRISEHRSNSFIRECVKEAQKITEKTENSPRRSRATKNAHTKLFDALVRCAREIEEAADEDTPD